MRALKLYINKQCLADRGEIKTKSNLFIQKK